MCCKGHWLNIDKDHGNYYWHIRPFTYKAESTHDSFCKMVNDKHSNWLHAPI